MSEKLCPGAADPPRVKNTNRFSVGAPVQSTTLSQSLIHEMRVYEVESMSDFDKILEFDPMTRETGFKPISTLSMKFWADSSMKLKYPLLSQVALNVSSYKCSVNLTKADSSVPSY